MILGGCEPSQYTKDTSLSFTINSFYVDKDNALHIAFYKGYDDNIRQYAHFDRENKIWINEKAQQFQLDSANVSFNKNIVTVKKNNQTIFSKELPTTSDIENELNISLTPNYITYTTYRSLLNLQWDRKSYIVSVLDINKEKVFYIFMTDINGSFTYQIYNNRKQYSIPSNVKDNSSMYMFDINGNYLNFDSYLKYSIDSKAPLCSVYWNPPVNGVSYIGYSCYIKKDTKLIKKDLFDIYPYYKDIHKNKFLSLSDKQIYIVRHEIQIFFDAKENMHMFYNKYDDLNGRYFYYEMYSKDNPSTPLYQQKIYWK